LRRSDNGDRALVLLHDYFNASLHFGQHGLDVAGELGCGDVTEPGPSFFARTGTFRLVATLQ
jgi:hypothetical protein